jgi:transposase
MWLPAEPIALDEADRTKLEGWIRAKTTPQSIAQRARIVLFASDGWSNNRIAQELGVTRSTVIDWRQRFETGGVDALAQIRCGGTAGRIPALPQAKVDAVVDMTLRTKPKGATHWSCRSMAKAAGISAAAVQRIWDAHGLQPHRVETFKLSSDPDFIEKLTDVVGLYLNPPDKAIVLCVDEKSQIQALDRTQPSLPMKRGRAGTMTHDYKRHGVTSLFAALDVAEGTVIGQCYGRHRHQEFLRFLKRLDDSYPKNLKLHLILDNYGTHKHPRVKTWLAAHRRFVLHFTPTGSSWLNLVERWFRELTDKQIRRGVFRSVADLVRAIREFMAAYNRDPKPFVWTASAQSIIDKVGRCRATLETVH